MLTFEPAFRTLLLKKIRGLTDEQLTTYEALVALRHELIQMLERDPKNERLPKQIEQAGNRAYDQIKKLEDQFNALHELWIARRRLALQQSNYFQVPFNLDWKRFFIHWRKLYCYGLTWLDYRLVQVKTWATLQQARIKKSPVKENLKEHNSPDEKLKG
jgi:hypothetical protein